MKIFGSLDTPIPPHPSQMLVGRQVANTDFLEALWRHGTFDEYHFFPGDHHDARLFEEAYRPLWEALGITDRVRIFSRWRLLDQLAATPYHVFHQNDFVTWFAELCQLRSRYAVRRFPVTAPIHSLSYPAYQQVYLRLMLTGPEAYDAIICTSRAGLAAVDEAFRRIGTAEALQPLELRPRMVREVIPLGMDVERFSPASLEQKVAARQALGLPIEGVMALCLGRFSEADKYDIMPLLRAFQLALKTGREAGQGGLEGAVLVLAGARQGNNYPERMLSIAEAMGLKGRVHLMVDVDRTAQQRLYQAADLFVSPSDNLQETFGLTVLEAMAAGLPVVVSDWDGYKDLVDEGVTGLRVPIYVGDWDGFLGELGPVAYQRPWHMVVAQSTVIDVPALADALGTLLSDGERRLSMGRAGRERTGQFAWAEIIRRYQALWERLSLQAAEDTRPPPPPSPFAQPPFSLFPGHPTRVLNSEDRLELTDLGEALLLSPGEKPWYLEIDPLLDMTVVRHLLSMARRKCTLGQAVTMVADAQCLPVDRTHYQLAWTLKQDLVRLRHESGEA